MTPSTVDLLLERFPVSERELDVLLSTFDPRSECGHNLPDIALGSDEVQEADKNSDDNSTQRQELLALERDLVAQLAGIFQWAAKTVYVAALPSAGPQDEANSSLLLLQRQATIVEAAVSLMGRRGSQFLVRSIFEALASDDGLVDADLILDLLHRLVWASYHLQHNDETLSRRTGSHHVLLNKAPVAWARSLHASCDDHDNSNNPRRVSWPAWKSWVARTAPTVPKLLSTVFHFFLLGSDCSFRSEPFQLPQLLVGESTNKTGDASQLHHPLWRHACEAIPTCLSLMELGGPWRRLYCSEHDGFSFRTMQQALSGYEGPTMLLIQTTKGDCLGYYTSTSWKSSPRWVDGREDSESFLFRVHPSWDVYGPVESGMGARKYRQYLHTPLSSRDKAMAGLAVGGVGVDSPRLHLTASLEGCKAFSMDTTFESGPLLSDPNESFFDVDLLQAWAVRCPTDEAFMAALSMGRLREAIKEANRTQIAKVDRRQFLDDFSSGTFMNSLYDHRNQTRGRHEFGGIGYDRERESYSQEPENQKDNLVFKRRARSRCSLACRA